MGHFRRTVWHTRHFRRMPVCAEGPCPGPPLPPSPGPGAPRLPKVGPPPRSPTGCLQSHPFQIPSPPRSPSPPVWGPPQAPVPSPPVSHTSSLAIGLRLRHVIQHRELLDLRSRRSPSAPHSRAFVIQQVDSGLAGVACAFDRRHHTKRKVRGGGKQVLGLHWCVLAFHQ